MARCMTCGHPCRYESGCGREGTFCEGRPFAVFTDVRDLTTMIAYNFRTRRAAEAWIDANSDHLRWPGGMVCDLRRGDPEGDDW